MLSISHALTGGLVASKLPYPAVYVPLAFAFHYLEDWIPHWDVGTGLSNGKRKRSTAIILELGELVITFGLIYWFWQAGNAEIQWHVWAGAFAALIPDFMEAPRNFLDWEPPFLKAFNDVHGMFHHSTMNKVVGLIPQVVVVLLVWWLR